MNKFLKVNFIYFSLLCFIILNLSCEQSEVFSPHVDSDDNTYYFDISNEIVGSNLVDDILVDYADNDDDYTLVHIALHKTLDFTEVEAAGNKTITINWDINSIPNLNTSKLETFDGIEVNNGDEITLDASGEISLKWKDYEIAGDVEINCSYTDNVNTSWNSLDQDSYFAQFDQPAHPLDNLFTITPITYDLDFNVSTVSYPSGTSYVGDYSDYTTFANIPYSSYTIFNVSLMKNETNNPANSKVVKFQWDHASLTQNDGSYPHLVTSNGVNIESGETVTTDENGLATVYWVDNGIDSDNISIECEYIDTNNENYAVQQTFSVISQYDKVHAIEPLSNPVVAIEDGGGTVILNPLEAYVLDENGQGVEYIQVHISPQECVGCPVLIFPPGGMVKTTDAFGLVSFEAEAINVSIDANLVVNFSIVNANLTETLEGTSSLFFEVANEVQTVIDPVDIFDLELTPPLFIYNDILHSVQVDSTFSDSIFIEATAKRSNGTGIANVTVNFESILSESGISYGVLEPSSLTNQNGTAINVLRNINTTNLEESGLTSDVITIRASVIDEDSSVISEEAVATIIPLSLYNINQVKNLDFYFDNLNNTTIDAEGIFSDTLIAQVLNESGAGVEGVPIQFILGDEVGYISSSLEYSDSLGFARSVYTITGNDILLSGGSAVNINLEARVNDNHNGSLSRLYSLANALDIESIFLDLEPDTLILNDLGPIIASDPQLIGVMDVLLSSLSEYITDTLSTVATVRDVYGVGIPEVPVTFSNNTYNYGVLQDGLVYTDTNGVASNMIQNITLDAFDFSSSPSDLIDVSIQVNESYIDEGGFPSTEIHTDTTAVLVVPLSVYNIWKVDQMQVWEISQSADYNEDPNEDENNFAISCVQNNNLGQYLRVQAIDEFGSPVKGVPVNFDLDISNSDCVWSFIDREVTVTNDVGLANICLYNDYSSCDTDGSVDVSITVNIGGEYYDTDSTFTSFEEIATKTFPYYASQTIGSVYLEMEPELFLFNDLPSAIDPSITDSINIATILLDVNNSPYQGGSLVFTNNTPEYGFLDSVYSTTDEFGASANTLRGISSSFNQSYDYSNSSDTISVTVDAYSNDGTILASKSDTVIIIPQSIYNTNLVDDLTFQFIDPTNYLIYETSNNSDFADTLLAQVLSESSAPVENAPVNFSLSSDAGYITETPLIDANDGIVYSDVNGRSKIVFNLPGASISAIANSDNRELSVDVTSTVGLNTITETRTYTIIPLSIAAAIDLDAEIDTLLFNDLPSDVDSTETVDEIIFSAYVKDLNDALIADIRVEFENLTPGYGDLEYTSVLSDSSGTASNTLKNIDTENFDYSNYSDSLKIKISVQTTIEGVQTELEDSAKVIIIPKTLENISNVTSLESSFSQSLSTINNVTTTFSDTVTSQVLDASYTPVRNVPINYSLSSPNNIGYITNQIDYSDSLGFAHTVFSITPADMELFESEEITISVTVGNDFANTINRTYLVDGSVNIQDEVATLISTTILELPVVGFPDSLVAGNYNEISEQFCVTAIDDDGIAISGVPIEFELFGQEQERGSLSSNLVYTYPDSSYSSESTCVDSTLGSACVCYNLGIDSNSFDLLLTSPDSLKAHIPDPDNQIIDLQTLEFGIDIVSSSSFVEDLSSYAIPSFIAMNVLDSTYCDTIYAVAQSDGTSPLKDIPVLFELQEGDEQYGFLTKTYAVSDSLLYPPYIAATTAFCTWNDIPDLPEPVTIDITASVQLKEELTSLVQIPLSENLPDCPDCEESIEIVSEYNELPNVDELGDNVYSTLITATVIDSTENPVPNTLVQWEALKEDDGGALTIPIGSIDPNTFTDSLGVTQTTFSMGNDQGLAYIIATATALNLSDTTFVELSSTEAAYLELVQPVPNEIMVQGGGGIESTEIEVEIKDGNGNLVTDDYLVYFRLGTNAPNNSYLNEYGTTSTCVTSDNGASAVTLNSGNEPGSVSIVAALYPLTTSCESIECTDGNGDTVCDDFLTENQTTLDDGITQLAFTPVTIVTGAPYSGQINFSYVDITPITGAGLYEVPLSVQLEDIYANPVADSTNVYIWIEGHKRHWCSSENVADEENFPGLENEDCTFALGDTVKWGTTDDLGNAIVIDSLLYVLSNPLPANGFGQPYLENVNMQPGGTAGSLYWEPIPHPGQVVGEAKTAMIGPDGNSYPGIAFSNAYYGTSEIFERTVLKALTTNAEGEDLIIDSRNNHMGEPLLLPFQPGTVTATTSLATFDFSLPPHNPLAGGECDNGADDTQQITIGGFLTDFFQYPTGNGRLLLTAPGATILQACNPADTDGDGYVGFCDEDGNGVQTDNETIPDCSDCVAAQATWVFDDNSPADGQVDDDASVCITNGQGQCNFIIEFSEIINIPSGPCDAIGGDVVTYDDWQSDIILNLIDPLQAASPSVTITVIKSETD